MIHEQSKPKKIVIVGGGTAGWMAANLLASTWREIDICLVESKQIGIIGVGEGSTPHLKLFFDSIGLEDAQWMPKCNATYKVGITFDKWSTKPGFGAYFHPFAAQTDDIFTLPLFYKNIQARKHGYDVNPHPDHYFLQSYLSRQNRAPLAAESFPFGMAYGYHFDSALLGNFLADYATAKGVSRIFGEVEDVLLSQQGCIEKVILNDGQHIAADFFIDCTGFDSLLMQKTLKQQFKSFKDTLFNDAAVVLPTSIASVLPVETKATALSNGWAWNIPLLNRFGNGYVYSRDYIDANQAESELRQHLDMSDSNTEARHLSMKVGRLEKHWHKNCLAVGLSQGFIEPLEATAIALSFNTIAQFIQLYQRGNFSNQFEDAFNLEINSKFDGIKDYVVCHYKANQRSDTDYWRDNASNTKISDNLNKVLQLWKHSPNFVEDMNAHKLVDSYQAKSWACMLAGYGVFPEKQANTSVDYSAYHQEMAALDDFIRRCGMNFKQHHEQLAFA
ncbi:tryptophan halogenase family protein [Glaciecola siphonariae]|uniref:Tryptophan halogenase family protein n=1 Tax=Glaciecola siphonariae TaxID=521012 RepID=A0ABV9LZF0_9ALTE